MNKKTIIVVVIVLLVIALFWYVSKPTVINPSHDTTNITPKDNTPTGGGTSTNTSKTISAKLGEKITVNGATGTLTELVADSRCAVDVQCIWAGTVKVKVHFTYGTISQDETLTLGEMLTLYGHSITLTGVKPEKKSGVTIASSDYVFTFLIK